MTITIIKKADCPDCTSTEQFLDSRGIEHNALRADLDPEVFDFVVNVIGVRRMPVVLLHEGDWRDFRPEEGVHIDQQSNVWSGLRRDRLYGLPKQLEALAVA